MRRFWLLIVIALLLITSCIQKPAQTQLEEEFSYALGYRPLPEEFLKWWFENLEDIKSGKIEVIQWNGDTKLIANSQDIANTQIVLTTPALTSLPSYYLAPHTLPKNQIINGTCWAFATVGSLESALLTQLSPSELSSAYPFVNPYDPDLAEQFVAYHNVSFWVERPYGTSYKVSCQETNENIGGDIEFFSMYNLIRRGVPIESDFPYNTDQNGWIKWSAPNNNWKTRLVRSSKTAVINPYSSYQSLDEYIKTIKSALVNYGALAVSFMVYENFNGTYFSTKKVYTGPGGSGQSGGHAVLLVGWIDYFVDPASGYAGPVWILKNSWGTNWGRSLSDYYLSSDQTKGYFALPMITEQEFSSKTCPDWKIERSFMAVPIVDLQQKPYTILADHEEHTVGRISYIDVKVVDQNNQLVPNARVRMFFKAPSDGNWYPVVDVLTKQDVFITDSNGIATAAVLPNIEITNLEFYAYIVDNPSSEAYFTVTFKKPAWLFLIWMCADNNLENHGKNDLEEMENDNSSVSVIAMVDGKDVLADSIRVLDEFGEWKQIESLDQNGDFDSGNYINLYVFVALYKSLIQSSNYALILWDHGSAWIYDHKSSHSYSLRAIAFDDTSWNYITTPELRLVLEQVGGIDLLGMDACLMGSIEVLYELKDVAEYVVASSFSEPGSGWDYNFLKQIASTNDGIAVGSKIVDFYRTYYAGYSKDDGLSLAVYDMSKVGITAYYLDELAYRLNSIMDSSLRDIIHDFYPFMSKYCYDAHTNAPLLVDLFQFSLAQALIDDSTVQYWAGLLQSSLPDLVIDYYVEKTDERIDYPVSIFMPSSPYLISFYANDYNTLLFTAKLYWSDFLESWLQTGDVLRSTSFEPPLSSKISEAETFERILREQLLHNE